MLICINLIIGPSNSKACVQVLLVIMVSGRFALGSTCISLTALTIRNESSLTFTLTPPAVLVEQPCEAYANLLIHFWVIFFRVKEKTGLK